MENETVKRTFFCDELPHHMQVNASNGAIVKVVLNVVHPAGKKTTVIMGRDSENEGTGMTVARDSGAFAAITKERDHWVSGGVDEDEFTALLYWINRHPALVEALRQKAHEWGAALDCAVLDEPAVTEQEGGATVEMAREPGVEPAPAVS